MNLWIISRECAEIAEAGGVKSVTFSLCKDFSELGHKITLFIPVYKCTSFQCIKNLTRIKTKSSSVQINNKTENVEYDKGICTEGNFDVVFINHPSFAEKEGVYTYTEHEFELNPEHIKGRGHTDSLFLDILFQKAVCNYGKICDLSAIPQIVHCQDASTACLPAFLKKEKVFENTKSVVTIHNAGPAYHHSIDSIDDAVLYTGLSRSLLEKSLNNNKVEPFLLAAECGAYLTTVSEKYAEELIDPENNNETEGLSSIFSKRKITIKGITNGIDYDRYNPCDEKISSLPFSFDPEYGKLDGKEKCKTEFLSKLKSNDVNIFPEISKYGTLNTSGITKPVLISYHGRVTAQKGISVLIQSIPAILNNYSDVFFVLAGHGEISLENALIDLSEKYSGRVVYLKGYEKNTVRLATASCDFAVLPSFFEPCGLEDFIAQIFGTIPIAHKTGGLTKIENDVTGFLYSPNTTEALISKLSEVIAIKKHDTNMIEKIIKEGSHRVHEKYFWKKVIQNEYIPFFEKILEKK